MKLKFFAFLLTVMLILPLTVSASSLPDMSSEIPDNRTLPLLVDDAGLLTSGEVSELNAALEEISRRQAVDVAVITVSCLPDDYYDVQKYADDIYDYYGYGYGNSDDGILLLLTMAEREWAVSTYGYGITAFPDSVIDWIMDDCLYYISDGAYYSGFSCFAQLCDQYITDAKNGYTYDDPYGYIGGADGPTAMLVSSDGGGFFNLFVSLILAFIVSGIITGVWKSELNTVNKQTGASNYADRDSIRVTLSRDLFLYRNVSRVRRQTEQSSRSGGSIHRSSSGRSHGGRSGRF